MGRLIQWNLMTLDGYFEGEKIWDLDFHQSVWGEELERYSIDQLRSAKMLLFGRVTYEGMAAYWQQAQGEVADFMNHLPKVVFSRSLGRAEWQNTTLIRSSPVAEVEALKSKLDGDIYVFGSGMLCASLLDAGLFDELRLALAPLVLGVGTTLFGRDLARTQLKLLESRPLSNGCVILRYKPLHRH